MLGTVIVFESITLDSLHYLNTFHLCSQSCTIDCFCDTESLLDILYENPLTWLNRLITSEREG